ncbi:MAG TPA: TetR/AcrR family transcriptional regulator [Caulobacteraceae bacterium]|nr:TetR/AcrR family transcriptional regulator [Caulobacteraceae bacterium]
MKLDAEASTRERIAQVALDLFAKHGFDGASMRQIAGALGLRASSLYNHFPSKNAIFAELIESYGPANSASRLASPVYLALKHDPEAFCRKYAADLLDQWCDPREQRFMELLTAERNRLAGERDHFFDTLFSREVGAITDYFRGFALTGAIHAPDPRECASLLMAGLTFLRMEHFLITAQPSPRAVVGEALDRLLGNFLALVAPRGPP